MTTRWILVLTVLAVLTACAPPQVTDTSAEIAEATGRWEPTFNAGDLDGLVAIYAEDARLLPPNAEPMQGADALHAAFGPMIEAGQQISLEQIETVGRDDTGFNVGLYTVTTGDGTTVDRGKYVETWRRIDGSWKMTNDIWNSSLPAIAGANLMVVTHQVEDPERWLAAWRGDTSRERMFTEHGAAAVRVFRDASDPKRVGLVIEVTDRAALEAFLASPEAEQAKAADGVIGPTLRVLLPAG
ncbi:MAG: hypothetical protein Kow0062_00500 [Acidobacteriota bacterium]